MSVKTGVSFPKTANICAVVVSYNAGDIILQTLAPLYAQTGHIILVDNGSDATNLAVIERAIASRPGRITLINNEKNNLAAAQNIGIAAARDMGFEWVLLMDHDSVADTGMLPIMCEALQYYDQPKKVGIIAPNLRDANSSRRARYPQLHGKIWFKRRQFGNDIIIDNLFSVISSGSLIPIYVFDKIGGMDESLTIDYVDKDFCLRVVRAGFQIIAVREAVLTHRLGNAHDHDIPGTGLQMCCTHHSPERRYTITRNRVLSWFRHGSELPAFVLYDLLAMIYDILRILCFEEQKREKLSAVWQGVKDAFRQQKAAASTP